MLRIQTACPRRIGW